MPRVSLVLININKTIYVRKLNVLFQNTVALMSFNYLSEKSVETEPN